MVSWSNVLTYDEQLPYTVVLPDRLIPSLKCRLGATPIMELMIAARKAVPELQLEYGIAVDRVYTGTLMTSLDMAGQFYHLYLHKIIRASVKGV